MSTYSHLCTNIHKCVVFYSLGYRHCTCTLSKKFCSIIRPLLIMPSCAHMLFSVPLINFSIIDLCTLLFHLLFKYDIIKPQGHVLQDREERFRFVMIFIIIKIDNEECTVIKILRIQDGKPSSLLEWPYVMWPYVMWLQSYKQSRLTKTGKFCWPLLGHNFSPS